MLALYIALLFSPHHPPRQDGLQAVLVVSRDHHFESKWHQTLGRSGVKLASSSQAFRGERIYLRLFLIGPALNDSGEADVVFDLSIIGPDGRVLFAQNGLQGVSGKLDPRNVYVARSTPVVDVEPDDPLGKREVKVVVHDRVADARVEKQAAFTMREFEWAGRGRDEDLENRLMNYYARPDPACALALLGLVDRADAGESRRGLAVQLSPFFRTLLRDNRFLLKPLGRELKQREPDKRRPLLPIIKAVADIDPAWVKELDLTESEQTELKNLELPALDGDITTPQQLDMLWSAFFAGGDIDPIRRIVGAIPLAEKDDVKLLLTTGRAAIWSLESNARQHELVRDYCRFLLEQGGHLDASTREALEKIVADAGP